MNSKMPDFTEVCLCFASVDIQFEYFFPYESGLKAIDLLNKADLSTRWPGIDWSSLAIGIWGKLADKEKLLVAGDRVELYRPLTIDPKQARRLRQAKR